MPTGNRLVYGVMGAMGGLSGLMASARCGAAGCDRCLSCIGMGGLLLAAALLKGKLTRQSNGPSGEAPESTVRRAP